MLDNRQSTLPGSLHLDLKLGNKRIAYAYIRKNACSAFKRALGCSEMTRIKIIALVHGTRPWRKYDATIFVYRDPVERLTSLYRNKVLQQTNAGDILRRYRSAMGEDPTTFEKFVEFATLEVDEHCIPQYKHLRPIIYTHAIPMDRLYPELAQLVGMEAAQPFKAPVNSSRPQPVAVSGAALEMIKEHYAHDYKLIAQLVGSGRVGTV